MSSDVREYAVDKTTTEKLEAMLNNLAMEHRKVTHLEFEGGRDWVVVSEREPLLTQMVGTLQSVGHCNDQSSDRVLSFPPGAKDPSGFTIRSSSGVHVGIAEHGYQVDDKGAKRPSEYGGFVEDELQTWILWLDPQFRPAVMWLQREPDGGVIGDPVTLGWL